MNIPPPADLSCLNAWPIEVLRQPIDCWPSQARELLFGALFPGPPPVLEVSYARLGFYRWLFRWAPNAVWRSG